jgi:hypothetical protein
VTPFDALSPPDVTSWFPLRSLRQAARRGAFPIRPSPGFFSARQSVQAAPDVILGPPPVLSWAFPLQGSPMTRDGYAFTYPPLPHFRHRPKQPEGCPTLCPVPQSVLHKPCGWSLARLPSFLGFLPFSLFTSLRSSRRPGLSFHLGARSASPPPDRPSSGLACSDRSKTDLQLRFPPTCSAQSVVIRIAGRLPLRSPTPPLGYAGSLLAGPPA